MKKRPTREPPATTADGQQAAGPQPNLPAPGSLAALTALGVLSALWALFLWAELVVARQGGTPFCALGAAADCSAVWDSAFASAVHAKTGLPVAGWGLVWGLVASVVPLFALMRLAESRPLPALVTAVRLAAAAGALAVFVFVGVSLSERAFCSGCFVTYLLVAGYAGIALFGWQRFGLPDLPRALSGATGLTLAGFLLLLYPGTHTPRKSAEAGREAIAKATTASATPAPVGTPAGASSKAAPGTGDPARDARLRSLVDTLADPLKLGLSNALFFYRNAEPRVAGRPRHLIGAANAPVRVTEFADVLCSHCAELHETLETLRDTAPAGSFAIEPRQYPLDGECNPHVRGRGNPVRCAAARALLCMEQRGDYWAFSGALFQRQRQLSPEMVFALASPYVARPALEACMASADTAEKLRSDVELAQSYGIEGTPLVLINGRRGAPDPPFLLAMALTRGAAEHPAFDSLPPPNPAAAHVH